MRRFYEALEAGEQPPAETLQFLADAFRKMHKGADAKEALKLIKKRGRKDESENQIENAVMVEEILLTEKGDDNARRKVAEIVGQDFTTVRRHHKKIQGHRKRHNKSYSQGARTRTNSSAAY